MIDTFFQVWSPSLASTARGRGGEGGEGARDGDGRGGGRQGGRVGAEGVHTAPSTPFYLKKKGVFETVLPTVVNLKNISDRILQPAYFTF